MTQVMKNLCHSVAPSELNFLLHKTCFMFFSQGAATTCYVALNPQLKGVTGKYFADCNEEKTSKHARSDALAERLWEFSEELIRSAH